MNKNSNSKMLHSGKIIDSINGYDILQCSVCKFKHINPIPKPDELENYYTKKFYNERKPEYLKLHKQDLEWWNLVYSERYDYFEKFLDSKNRRILDLGCGPGFFLKFGKERGWETLGIEPSPLAANHASSLGLKIINEFFTDSLSSRIGKFDVVYMQGVLEHLPDPISTLRLCYNILKKGGILCTIQANDYNPLQNLLRSVNSYDPWWLVPPDHINYFTISSIKKIVKLTGFEIERIITTFPMEFFLLMGDNYVGNEILGRSCHKRRMNFEKLLHESGMKNFKQKLYKFFAQNNIGRDSEVIARKF